MSRWGRDDLAQADERPLQVEQDAELGLRRTLQDLVLELVDAVVESAEHREERVDLAVDDHVQEDDLRRDVPHRVAPVDAPVDVDQGRARFVVHGDDAVGQEEDVQLRGPGPLGGGTVDDEVGEVIELVDLRSLAEVLGILDRQGVQVPGVGEQVRDASSSTPSRSSQKEVPDDTSPATLPTSPPTGSTSTTRVPCMARSCSDRCGRPWIPDAHGSRADGHPRGARLRRRTTHRGSARRPRSPGARPCRRSG